ncbi:DNA topoisomerase IB [Ensifer adhaerens]|uniref:DNA topoisomerase IB n=1 Tax=Ensifer adhaerens TaxID=106592 RepID=UPI000DD6E51A|nr:DNA topoisomerase IB [Ensifer adhaerens]
MSRRESPQVGDGAGLIYVSDTEPGYTRFRSSSGFVYRRPNGEQLKDSRVLARIQALGLPPAYENVWICMQPNGHLQATGYDARGRKQYRYHQAWQEMRSNAKYSQLPAFAKTLPRLRRRIRKHMEGPVDDPFTVLAALAALLDHAPLRIGNSTYVKENGSYGASTLLKRHLKITDDSIELNFKGKGGQRIRRRLRNPRLQRLLEGIAELPGRQLFVSVGQDGKPEPIESGRFNRYLAEISGAPISAKTFRTWAGSVAAYSAARQAFAQGRRPTIKEMCNAAAEALHNTPAVCRKSYVHPAVLALAQAEQKIPRVRPNAKAVPGLRADEMQFLRFLNWLARHAQG